MEKEERPHDNIRKRMSVSGRAFETFIRNINSGKEEDFEEQAYGRLGHLDGRSNARSKN